MSTSNDDIYEDAEALASLVFRLSPKRRSLLMDLAIDLESAEVLERNTLAAVAVVEADKPDDKPSGDTRDPRLNG